MLNEKKVPMKTTAQKHSANSDRSVLSVEPTSNLVNALVYVKHRPGHLLFFIERENFIKIIFY